MGSMDGYVFTTQIMSFIFLNQHEEENLTYFISMFLLQIYHLSSGVCSQCIFVCQ